ncbi:hypothetical protein CQ054_06710 [Ochrobactrum sp. MYb29]|nr:hypothetical protein CQ054_06710 [Ochrobactrum sp. MYb29]
MPNLISFSGLIIRAMLNEAFWRKRLQLLVNKPRIGIAQCGQIIARGFHLVETQLCFVALLKIATLRFSKQPLHAWSKRTGLLT